MKRIGSMIIVIALILSVASMAYAQNPQVKLGRGIINTLTGFWEVPIDMLKTSKAEGMPMGLSVGLVRGLATGIYRTLVGVYEVVTFPIPAPAGFTAITDPETLITSETLEKEDPKLTVEFSPLSSQLQGSSKK